MYSYPNRKSVEVRIKVDTSYLFRKKTEAKSSDVKIFDGMPSTLRKLQRRPITEEINIGKWLNIQQVSLKLGEFFSDKENLYE